MLGDPTGLIEAKPPTERLLGQVCGGASGPTLIAMAAVHGNESAGLQAAERVLSRIRREGTPLRGTLVFLAGNLSAIRRRTRFIDKDLNREWTVEKVAALLDRPAQEDRQVEAGEQRALIEAIRTAVAGVQRPVYFLDMHTSSAPGPPFVTVGDTLRNRRFAERFPLPMILGLEEQIDGSLLEYLNNCGFVTLGLEAGQHDSADSVDRLEAVLWLSLTSAGLVAPQAVSDLARYGALLERASRGVPRVIEVRHRHAIVPEDEFRMDLGYSNFQPIRKNQPLARDRHGLVLAPATGLVLLPLYQGKGDDGFFVAREVRPLWLAVSAALRRMRLASAVRLLPGVRRDGKRGDVLAVNTKIARLYPLEIFHLLGYRKQRRSGVELRVSRRMHDLRPPQTIRFP